MIDQDNVPELSRLPRTPLLELARERGWRIGPYDDDGSGAVEIAPGIWLELRNGATAGIGDPDDWTASVQFSLNHAPPTGTALAAGMPTMLLAAVRIIAGVTDEDVDEAREEARGVSDAHD